MKRQAACILLVAWMGGFGLALAQPSDRFEVVVEDGQTLRSLAQAYLNDPNLWPEILHASGLKAPREVRPGVRVRIPLTAVTRANRAIIQARDALRAATRSGARLFATPDLEAALARQEDALGARKRSDWDGAYAHAQAALRLAAAAEATSRSARDQAAEAVLSDRKGSVQGRRASQLVWEERSRQAILLEQERLRTLSNSLAEITFRNESTFRLDANTNVVIQKMRVDLLDQKEQTQVNLVAGDVYALLRGTGTRQSFDVQVEGVETSGDSRHYWMSRTANAARVANYDDQPLQVAAGGASVVLSRNEGTHVAGRQTPTPPRVLLPPPRPMAPADNHVAFVDGVALAWAAVPGASAYWVEVAVDPAFQQRVESLRDVRLPRVSLSGLPEGAYFWRVWALDETGIPGQKSQPWRFLLRTDPMAPFLAWRSPQTDTLVATSILRLTAEAEEGVGVTLNGRTLGVGPGGDIETDHTLQEGPNTLVLAATDAAGRTTERRRSVAYHPPRPVPITVATGVPRDAEGRLLVRDPRFTLVGQTAAHARLQVTPPHGDVRQTTTDAEGLFRINLFIRQQDTLWVRVVTPTGGVTEERVVVVRDTVPPVIVLDAPLPLATDKALLAFSGQVSGGTALACGEAKVPLADGRFEVQQPLTLGDNTIRCVATDPVGHTAYLVQSIHRRGAEPVVERHRLGQRTARGGEAVRVDVWVTADVPLRHAALLSWAVGDERVETWIRQTSREGHFTGALAVPVDGTGTLRLLSLTLEDHSRVAFRLALP